MKSKLYSFNFYIEKRIAVTLGFHFSLTTFTELKSVIQGM
jgi:hypothetical protein